MKYCQRIITSKILDRWSIISVSSFRTHIVISNRQNKQSIIKKFQNDTTLKYSLPDARGYNITELHSYQSCMSTFGWLKQKTGSTIK